MSSKAELRRRFRAAPLPDEAARGRASIAIASLVCQLDAVRSASAIAMFVGVGHEPDTAPTFDVLDGKRRWFPIVTDSGPDSGSDSDSGKSSSLSWSPLASWTDLVPGPFGLREPRRPERAQFPPVEVVLIPGLAFDRNGGRLGWGRGYYDRALAGVRGVLRVGLCQGPYLLEEAIPMEAHDQRLNVVVTPTEVIVVDSEVDGGNTRRGAR